MLRGSVASVRPAAASTIKFVVQRYACHFAAATRAVRRTSAMPPAAADAPSLQADGAAGPSDATPRVLSIQSHVVHGYVGNKCATFPLQRLGFEVDPVMSVQFSNHTGYPSFKGHVFGGDDLSSILSGLQSNGLVCYSHLLTGYIGSRSLLHAVVAVAQALRSANPGVSYVCDPVMGDEGRLYVSPELVEEFKAEIVPLASVLTPNQFEAELLTGTKIGCEADALAACSLLHQRGPHTVIITSMEPASAGALPATADGQPAAANGGAAAPDAAASGGSGDHGHITLIASTTLPQAAGRPAAFRLRIPKLPAYFTGTGDLLAALLLARIHSQPGDLASAVELAVAGLQGVLHVTAAACGPAAMAAGRSAAVFAARELRLVQAQGCLAAPQVTIRAEPLS